MYLVPKELKSKPKITERIYVSDFFFLLAYGCATYVASSAVNSALAGPFYLFSAAMAAALLSSSPKNARRRKWQEIAILAAKLLDEKDYKWEGGKGKG